MWKYIVLLACLCAFAHAQTRRPSSTAAPKPKSSDTVSVVSKPNAPKPALDSNVCKEKNERYSIPGSCDKYIECLNGTAEEKQCPDGLRYNPNLNYKMYPCVYPNEYQCLERSALQPADPTEECPNQFGYYKLGDSKNCTWFRNCVNGVGYDVACPEGLAYNPESYRCEWPDEVPDCDAEAFIGFRCPELKISEELGAPTGFRFYRNENDCQKFFLCIGNKPRIMRCGGEAAYDELTTTCVSADQIESCPMELKLRAKQIREEEELRNAKEAEFSANPPLHKKRL